MPEALELKDIAFAAAQGVAIALSARKQKPGEEKDEFFINPILTCGGPSILFNVTLLSDGHGGYTVGPIVNKAGASGRALGD